MILAISAADVALRRLAERRYFEAQSYRLRLPPPSLFVRLRLRLMLYVSLLFDADDALFSASGDLAP